MPPLASSAAAARRTPTRARTRTSSSSPSTPEGALDTARELRDSIGSRPLLSVASELRFTKAGALPAANSRSLAERIQAELDGQVVSGLHSLAAASLGADEPPDEDAFVCGDDADAKAQALDLAERLTSRTCARRRAPCERARPRGLHGRHREHEPALQGARRDPRHRARLTGELRVIPFRGIPELEEGDDLGALLVEASSRAGGLDPGDVLVVAQKAVSKVEGRVVHLGDVEPSAARSLARRRRATRAGSR